MGITRRLFALPPRPLRVVPTPHRPATVSLERVAGSWEYGGVRRDLRALAARLSHDGRTLSLERLQRLDLGALVEHDAAGVELLKAAYFAPAVALDEAATGT